MKNLLEYIKESLLDDFEDISSAIDYRDEILKFLDDTYTVGRMYTVDKIFKISEKPNKKGFYEVDAPEGFWIDVKDDKKKSLEYITNGMFVFNKVGGFSCHHCPNLKSLEGAPKETGYFACCYCPNLKSLKGAPQRVNTFNCSGCDNLVNLKGAPRYIFKSFDCSECLNLTSLVGAPTEIWGNFYCFDNPKLKSLKGIPSKIHGNIECGGCGGDFNKSHVENVCKVDGKIIIE